MSTDIFISHSSDDGEIAKQLCTGLEGRGADVWIAPRDIGAGAEWDEAIIEAIQASDEVLVLISDSANGSQQVKREISLAEGYDTTIIPVLIDGTEPADRLKYFIQTKQWLEIGTQLDDEAIDRIVGAVSVGEVSDRDETQEEETADDDWASGWEHSEEDLRQIASQMRRNRIATAWSIENEDEEMVDRSHFYEEIKRIDTLDTPNDGWSSIRWLTVRNESEEPTNSVIHKESGDIKITFEDMNLKGFLGDHGGQRLKIRSLIDQQPSFEQKIRIYFPDPLPPGESLTICYEISWPGEPAHYSPEEQTQSISLTRYQRGVGRLQFGIVDTIDHVGLEAEKLAGTDQNPWQLVTTTPTRFEADERTDLAPVHGEGLDGYIYDIEHPDAPAYRINYTPL